MNAIIILHNFLVNNKKVIQIEPSLDAAYV